MEKTAYMTLVKRGEAVYEDRKSEFIGYCAHAESEEEALSFIAEIRKKHTDARHNVYAYMLSKGNITRYSDDGEPGGTAGMPVLDVIRKTGFTDAVIVVTRYFGGILLGTGGLVKAYTTAAREAVKNAGVGIYAPFSLLSFGVDYSLYQKLGNLYKKYCATEEEAEFTDLVRIKVCLPGENADSFASDLFSLSSGRVTARKEGERLAVDRLLELS